MKEGEFGFNSYGKLSFPFRSSSCGCSDSRNSNSSQGTGSCLWNRRITCQQWDPSYPSDSLVMGCIEGMCRIAWPLAPLGTCRSRGIERKEGKQILDHNSCRTSCSRHRFHWDGEKRQSAIVLSASMLLRRRFMGDIQFSFLIRPTRFVSCPSH